MKNVVLKRRNLELFNCYRHRDAKNEMDDRVSNIVAATTAARLFDLFMRMVFLREVLEVFERDMMSVVIIVMRCQLVEFGFEVFHVSCMIVQFFDGRLCLIEIDSTGACMIVSIEDVM